MSSIPIVSIALKKATRALITACWTKKIEFLEAFILVRTVVICMSWAASAWLLSASTGLHSTAITLQIAFSVGLPSDTAALHLAAITMYCAKQPCALPRHVEATLKFPCCSLGGANWWDTLFRGRSHNSLAKKASRSELAPAHLKKWQKNQILTPKTASTIKNESAKPKNWSQNWLQKSCPFRRKEFLMLGFIPFTSAKGKAAPNNSFFEGFFICYSSQITCNDPYCIPCALPNIQGRPGMWPRLSLWFSEPILGAVWRSKFLRVAGVLCGVVLGICECEEVIFGVLYSFVGVALIALVFQRGCWWADELIGR